MNLFSKTLMAFSVASIGLSPVAAAAAPSPALVRAVPATSDSSDLRGNGNGRGGGFLVAVVLLAALAAAYLIIHDDNNNNGRPVSP